MRFSIKDVFWFTTLCAVLLMWSFTHHTVTMEKEGRRNDIQLWQEKLKHGLATQAIQQKVGTASMETVSRLAQIMNDQRKELAALEGTKQDYQSYQDQMDDLRSNNDALREEVAALKEKYEKD